MSANRKQREHIRVDATVNIPVQIQWDSHKKQATAVILDLSQTGIKVFATVDLSDFDSLTIITLKGNLEFEIIQKNKVDDFAFHYGLSLISHSPNIDDIFSSYITKSV